jgi:hypothetical protein
LQQATPNGQQVLLPQQVEKGLQQADPQQRCRFPQQWSRQHWWNSSQTVREQHEKPGG